jgi:hypothetical protein
MQLFRNISIAILFGRTILALPVANEAALARVYSRQPLIELHYTPPSDTSSGGHSSIEGPDYAGISRRGAFVALAGSVPSPSGNAVRDLIGLARHGRSET